MTSRSRLLNSVADYYTSKVREHGATAAGVDWNSPGSQRLRFDQLLKICDRPPPFALNDLGCGYGALCDYLSETGLRCDFAGYDVSEAMIAQATKLYATIPDAKFVHADRPNRVADYTVASGIFNVRDNIADEDWRAYIFDTLEVMNESSARGFSFNCLTSYSDPPRMRKNLFYADPAELFGHCKRAFSKDVALLHDYGLYEFTILVRKTL